MYLQHQILLTHLSSRADLTKIIFVGGVADYFNLSPHNIPYKFNDIDIVSQFHPNEVGLGHLQWTHEQTHIYGCKECYTSQVNNIHIDFFIKELPTQVTQHSKYESFIITHTNNQYMYDLHKHSSLFYVKKHPDRARKHYRKKLLYEKIPFDRRNIVV